jgi:hypothetical protein
METRQLRLGVSPRPLVVLACQLFLPKKGRVYMDLKKLRDFELRILGGNVAAELLKRENRSLFHDTAREFINNGRIPAIKFVRGVLGCGLKDGKEIVDYWVASEGWTTIRSVEVFSTVAAVFQDFRNTL